MNTHAFNRNKPEIMHIDLNSCFATVEQQAYYHLRGKPLVISAYKTPRGCVLAPSIEAKRYGIKTGMTNQQARLLCKNVIIRTCDTATVRDVHVRFRRIFSDYSPIVIPKSIDEAILDFTGMERYLKRDLTEVAQEIKDRIRAEIGEWMVCSVGIGTNRFLAKTAAGLKKPDGLEVITHKNIVDTYRTLTLTDLTGINVRYEARLNTHGIFTPLDMLAASAEFLKKRVFQSVVGYYWYRRLRGFEADGVEFARKSYGQDYSLKHQTADPAELSRLLMKLCEKMGRRLRKSGNMANGIHVTLMYKDFTHWSRSRKTSKTIYTTAELFREAQYTLNQQPERKIVRKLAVSCYDLQPAQTMQLNLFDTTANKHRQVSDAVDRMNDRYGEYSIIPGLMIGMKGTILDRIAFGNVEKNIRQDNSSPLP